MKQLSDFIKESASLFDIYGYRDEEEIFKYWIYAVDRKQSYLDAIFKTNDMNKLIETLRKLEQGKFHKVWNKKHIYALSLGEEIDGKYPNAREYTLPYVELQVTDGENNWATEVKLIYDIENKKLYYAGEGKGSIKYDGLEGLKLGKEWDGKIVFKRR